MTKDFFKPWFNNKEKKEYKSERESTLYCKLTANVLVGTNLNLKPEEVALQDQIVRPIQFAVLYYKL